MSLIQVNNLSFAYDNGFKPIFDNVSFQLDSAWKLGLIGRNGKGKTTFLNLLLNKYSYEGQIIHTVNFQYFPVTIQNEMLNTLEVIKDIYPDYQLWELQKQLSLLQVDQQVLSQPYNTLSGGQQTKIQLAVLFLKPHNFLLIDEPTNHLDLEGRKLLSKYLNQKSGYIIVSHDRNFLDGCIDHVLAINRMNIEVSKGNFSVWYNNKINKDKPEIQQNEHLKKDIKRLEKSAKQKENWADAVEKTKNGTRNSGLRPNRGRIGHKAAKMMSRAKNIEARKEKEISTKSTLMKNVEVKEDLELYPLAYPHRDLITFKKVSFKYDKEVFHELSFEVNNGDRLALYGPNGCGKSTVIKLILQDLNYSGTIKKGSNLIISYLPQVTPFLQGSLSNYASEHHLERSRFQAILFKLDFSRDKLEKNLEDFSAGEQRKVLIATSLSSKAHLFIWDEPLNYLDIYARIQIEELLLKFKPTLIFVEHDEAFGHKVATKIINL